METNIRELKAHLSEYIRRVEDGEIITVSIRNRPVTRIVPIKTGANIERLGEQAGIA
jgi:prevent-host-death family protein